MQIEKKQICNYVGFAHCKTSEVVFFQQAPSSCYVPIESRGSSAAGKGLTESHGQRKNGADREKIVSSFYCLVIQVIYSKSFDFIFDGYFCRKFSRQTD